MIKQKEFYSQSNPNINFPHGIQGSKYWNVEQRQYNLNQDDKTSNTCTGKILLPLQVNKSITFMLISGL